MPQFQWKGRTAVPREDKAVCAGSGGVTTRRWTEEEKQRVMSLPKPEGRKPGGLVQR